MVPSTLQIDRSRQIALLNDSFRTTFVGGSIFVSQGVHQAGDAFVKAALLAVRTFIGFDEDDTPEHDFGIMLVVGRRLYWKIDYYDPTMRAGSADPASLALTRRVLTVLLPEEY
jgi:hypothetical protein